MMALLKSCDGCIFLGFLDWVTLDVFRRWLYDRFMMSCDADT